jgi:hypothetical protein
MFSESVDTGPQICCTQNFFNLFLKYFLNINKACLIFAKSYQNALHYNAMTKLSPPINKRLMDSSFFLGTFCINKKQCSYVCAPQTQKPDLT